MDDINSGVQWEWKNDECSSESDKLFDVSSFLWDDGEQNTDDIVHILEDTTPVKSCMEFEPNGKADRSSEEECRESSQSKRRRMLQFYSNDTFPFCNEKFPSVFLRSKDREHSLLTAEAIEHFQWSNTISDMSTFDKDGSDHTSERWLENCFNEDEIYFAPCEMKVSDASHVAVDISESYRLPCKTKTDIVLDDSAIMEKSTLPTSQPSVVDFQGDKSYLQTSTKLTTCIAYPFALVKPCGAQGDVTLNEINRRILTPKSVSKMSNYDDSSLSFPTSAFSGKPVVIKTKIQTQGGRGSITIMRTKG